VSKTKRRKYSPEFKRKAVLLAQQRDAICEQIALDIGIIPNLLSRWKREAATFFAKELP
jgi:transposase-like protein|tara:strand:+ start:1814 stop:1990 length:177 start_codon:yes stop_codon:yes gene_type:complete